MGILESAIRSESTSSPIAKALAEVKKSGEILSVEEMANLKLAEAALQIAVMIAAAGTEDHHFQAAFKNKAVDAMAAATIQGKSIFKDAKGIALEGDAVRKAATESVTAVCHMAKSQAEFAGKVALKRR